MVRTFHHKEFSSVDLLLSAKKKTGTSISLIIPARNESGTIGTIVSEIKTKLIDNAPLIDELIVMDGDSDDATIEKARNAGAIAYESADIGPQVNCSGKGTNLWKSQFVCSGDIVVFIDADIMNFDVRFICGLIGPMLLDENIYLVKGFYDRPLLINGNSFENYGGRVTEILVRPLLSTLVPDLAWVRQPLAGEYAMRRMVMENLPFSSGYGVEIGLLYDLYRKYGLSHIAQVNMETRIHRNRSVGELSRMAFSVLHAFMVRCREEGVVTVNGTPGTKIVSFTGDTCEETEMVETNLPSMVQFVERALQNGSR